MDIVRFLEMGQLPESIDIGWSDGYDVSSGLGFSRRDSCGMGSNSRKCFMDAYSTRTLDKVLPDRVGVVVMDMLLSRVITAVLI